MICYIVELHGSSCVMATKVVTLFNDNPNYILLWHQAIIYNTVPFVVTIDIVRVAIKMSSLSNWACFHLLHQICLISMQLFPTFCHFEHWKASLYETLYSHTLLLRYICTMYIMALGRHVSYMSLYDLRWMNS